MRKAMILFLCIGIIVSGTACSDSSDLTISRSDLIESQEEEPLTFYVNGKPYELGVYTLMDLVNAGVPFAQDSLDNMDDDLTSGHLASFDLDMPEYHSAYVEVFNDTNKTRAKKDCKVTEIWVLPKEDEIGDLSFDFPIDITEEELLEQYGDPDDESEYGEKDGEGLYQHTYTYTNDYYRVGQKITFQFNSKGTISYIGLSTTDEEELKGWPI